MKYFVMHEDKKLALIDIHGDNIVNIKISDNPSTFRFMPLLDLESSRYTVDQLKHWVKNRGIPVTRHRIKLDLENGSKSPFKYMLDNLGLSLTDHYWLNPCDKMYTWEYINLYINDFKSNYSLNIRDDVRSIAGKTNFVPSASLKGDLKKKWIIDEFGTRRLVKGNYSSSCRQSISEVLASEIHRRQGLFEYTPYSFIEISSDGQLITGCECPNFTDINTEFIPAIDIVNSFKKDNRINYYDAYIAYCGCHGINEEYMRNFMEYQILTDFIITNTDRHLNNFGVIRDSRSLKFIKPAPIFDSGNSLFYNTPNVKVDYGLLNIDVTSFRNKEIKLLEYVRNPGLVDVNKLPSAMEVRSLLNKDISIKDEILDRVARAYGKKIQFLLEFQGGTKIYSYNYLKKYNINLNR